MLMVLDEFFSMLDDGDEFVVISENKFFCLLDKKHRNVK